MPFDVTPRAKMPRVEIEVLLVSSKDNDIQIKTDESAKPIWIPRTGLDMTAIKRAAGAAVSAHTHIKIRLTESKAIAYGLV